MLLGGFDHVLHQCLRLFHHTLSHMLSLGLILETDQRVWTHLHKTPASLLTLAGTLFVLKAHPDVSLPAKDLDFFDAGKVICL